MIKSLPTRKVTTLLLGLFFFISTATAGIEPIPSGSFIINMGVVPQTYSNGLKPYGMIWTLIHNYKVQVKWVINQSKAKDGIDFTYNGTDYKGGTFIIPKSSRSAKVDSTIAAWQSQGVVGTTTTSDFNADVTYTIKYNPLWTFDFQNGKIALNYLTIAGIPTTGYPMKNPADLNDCDDIFVMPHADPTWATHQNLLFWNSNNRGWLWYGCHAGSVIESTLNPADSSQQMDFLTTTGLINYSDHKNPTTPYSYRYPGDPEMQFMGTIDAAVTNGSEQVYLPKLNGGWRPSTSIAVWDPSDPDVPSISHGDAAIIAYGRAFGDTSKGKVMFQAGHNFDNNNAAAVSAIRAFFNFSYLSVLDKIVTPVIHGAITASSGIASAYSATLPAGYDLSNYSFHWSATCPGVFSNEFGASTTFTASPVNTASCRLTVTITDGCGREYYETLDMTISGVPPVALDRTCKTILNPAGTGPQPIGNLTPLAGTDTDGYVVNYILKSLPANGVLYYDNDNNSSTADIAISSLPGGGLSLTNLQMKSLKFDPNDNFGGNTNFQYTVQDNTNLFSLNTATYNIHVNIPPVAQTFICTPVTSNAGSTPVCPLVATDDNSVVSYTVVSVPSSAKCSVYLYNVLVVAGQVITPQQASQLTYKPGGTYAGYAEITYSATDNEGAPSDKLATITLQMVNQPPVPQDIAANAINNPAGTTQFGLKALVATDADGTVASYTITNVPAASQGILYYNSSSNVYSPVSDGQLLTLQQAANLKFDPADNFSGVATFKYTATDDGNLTNNQPATYSIPVKATPPQASDITNQSIYTGTGLTSVSALIAHDPDSTDIITAYIIKKLPAGAMGILYYNVAGVYLPCVSGQEMTPSQGATLKFSPNGGFTGKAIFTYTAKDDEGQIDPTPATFTIPVTNLAPRTNNVSNPKIYDTTKVTTLAPLSGTDADGSVASYEILTLPDPSTGVLTLQDQNVTIGQTITPAQANILQFTPVLHNNKNAQFNYTAIDNFGVADPQGANYSINIQFVNYKRAPTADDKNNPALNVNVASQPLLPVSGLAFDGASISTYQITNIPDHNQGTLYLQGVPVVQNQTLGSVAAGQLTFIPTGNFKGNSKFNYISTDNNGVVSSGTANFTVPLINIPPVANNFTASQVAKNSTALLPGLQASDSDGSVVSYKIVSLPVSATLKYDSTGTGVYLNANANMVLTPGQASKLKIITTNTTGNISFQFTAKDNLNDTSTVATYTIPVGSAAVNQKPIANDVTSTPVPYNAGVTAISPLSATDADGSISSFIIESIPPAYYGTLYYDSSGYYAIYRGIIQISALEATTLKFAPSGIFTGNATFVYRAIDNSGAYSATEATYTIPIVNTAPTVNNITNPAIPGNNGPTLLTPLTASANGTIAKYVISSLPNPAQGTLIMDGSPISLNQTVPSGDANRVEFSPNNNFSGNATFKFTAMDNFGQINGNPATFTIPITNQPPVADNKVSQVITNFIGTPVQPIPALTATDNDGTIASYSIKTLPAGGKLYKNGTLITTIPIGGLNVSIPESSQLSFDPDDNYGGSASFTYTAKDNSNNVSAAATYQVLLNTPPVTNNINASSMYPSQARASIPALSGSDDGAIAFYSILTLPDVNDGRLYLNNIPVTSLSQVDSLTAAQVSQLSFQPLSTFDGAIFTYTATDNTGLIDVTPAVYKIPYLALQGTLAVELVSFNGLKSGADDILKWSTAQEINSDHFDVEQSSDGVSFSKIGEVMAKGNSSVPSDYSFTDKNVGGGIHYYRLKLVNTSSSAYSNIVDLKRDGQTLVISKANPNPFHDMITIDITAGSNEIVTLNMYDINGKIVRSTHIPLIKGDNQISLHDLNELNPGIYLLKIRDNEIETNVKLFKIN